MTMIEGVYSADDLNMMMGKYEFPVTKLTLFNLVLEKYNELLSEDDKITEILFEGTTPGGGTYFEATKITFPASGTLAAMPVTSFAGG